MAPTGIEGRRVGSGLVEDLRLIIVGAQKGGSTAVARALAEHPEIYLPRGEIPLFEGDLFNAASVDRANRILRRGNGRLLGLKRPDLLVDPEAPARIASTVRDPLVVAVLRDPVERAISAYWWYVQMGLLPLEEIEVGMRRLIDAHDGAPITGARRHEQVLQFGFYNEGLQRYRAAVGSDRTIVLMLDDLRDGSWSRAVTGALGIDDHAPCVRSENTGTYDMSRLRFLRLRARLLADSQRADYHEQRRRFRYRAGRVAARGLNEIDRQIIARTASRPVAPLGPETVSELRALYRPDSEALERAIGRPLPWLSSWDAPASSDDDEGLETT